MSELTPREWQDIEKAKAALRIDAGWPDVIDLAPEVVARDASTPAMAPVRDAAAERDPQPPVPRKSTPEAQGLPTAG